MFKGDSCHLTSLIRIWINCMIQTRFECLSSFQQWCRRIIALYRALLQGIESSSKCKINLYCIWPQNGYLTANQAFLVLKNNHQWVLPTWMALLLDTKECCLKNFQKFSQKINVLRFKMVLNGRILKSFDEIAHKTPQRPFLEKR